MTLIKRAATANKDTKQLESGWSVNCATSGFMKLVSKINQYFSSSLYYFVVKFSYLYKSVLLFTIQWKLVALIFPQNHLMKLTF